MAYYFLYPEKDTTIYSHPYRQDLNTGIVETLSLTSEKGVTDDLYYPSRILLKSISHGGGVIIICFVES